MTLEIQTLECRVLESLETVPPDAWNALLDGDCPFLSHAWLRAMETTDRVVPDTGWLPQILTAWSGDTLVGAVPMYVKGNSYGEFVYDWAWAELASRLGIPYYPKLIAAIPFSPVTGNRLLLHPDLDSEQHDAILRTLIRLSLDIAQSVGVSGLHYLFVSKEHADILRDEGFMIRTSFQYHWANDAYSSFDDFLGKFRAKKRNKIKREIKDVDKAGVSFTNHNGHDLDDEHLDHIVRFYEATCHKFYWGRVYLNHDFFRTVRDTMPDALRIFFARNASGTPVAGAFTLQGQKRLFGRYWGCDEEVSFLHFSTCYYEPVRYAIEQGLDHFEPGTGGDHKFARGFNPSQNWSAHWVADSSFESLLRSFLARETKAVEGHIQELLQASPIRPKEAS